MKIFKIVIVLMLMFGLSLQSACQKNQSNTLKVGTIAGPESTLMETAKKVAKEKYNLDIQIIEFTDYVEPNTALSDGSIDANMFQHQPYLDQQIKDKKYELMTIGKTFVYPMGVYSKKIKNLNDLKVNSIVAIPNDPSNEGRALLLLQKNGLITLNLTNGLYQTPLDIQKNPKKLSFKELDAAQLARSLEDVDLAVINTNYAVAAGLSPSKDALVREGSDSPYANIIVIRKNSLDDPRMQNLVKSIQSNEVIKTAKEIFNDQAIPAWNHS